MRLGKIRCGTLPKFSVLLSAVSALKRERWLSLASLLVLRCWAAARFLAPSAVAALLKQQQYLFCSDGCALLTELLTASARVRNDENIAIF